MALHDHTTVGNKDLLLSVTNTQAPDKQKPNDAPGRQGLVANKLKKLGVGATLGTGQNWATKIKWSPVDPLAEDGAGVEAKLLGPDHPMGDTPDSANTDVCPQKHILENTTGDKTYIKGHLLNEHLGGPGNDTRNLTAIPYSTNKAMSSRVEEPLKKLVNEQLAWVYYKATVSHTGKGAKRHATRISTQWHQLKPDVNGDPEMVPGTAASCDLDIPTPAAYLKRGKNSMSYKAPTTSTDGGLKGKIGATTNNPAPELANLATAKAKTAWNSIVLRNWDYVRGLQQSLAITEPIINELKLTTANDEAEKVGTDMVGALSSPIAPEETNAMAWLAKELQALEKSSSRRPDPMLRKQLEIYTTHRAKRVLGTKGAFKQFLENRLPMTAGGHLLKINAFLDNDPFESTRGLLLQMLERFDRQDIEIAHDHVYGEPPMTPLTLDGFDHVDLEKEKDTKAPKQLERKRLRLDESVQDKEHSDLRERVRDTKSTNSAGRAVDAVLGLKFHNLMNAMVPLQPLDPTLHQMIVLLSNDAIDGDMFDSFVRGHRDKHPDSYLAYVKALFELAEVKSL